MGHFLLTFATNQSITQPRRLKSNQTNRNSTLRMPLHPFYMFAHYARPFRRRYTVARAVLTSSLDHSLCAFPLLTAYRRLSDLKDLEPRRSRVFLLAVDVFSSLSDVLRGWNSLLEAFYSPLVRGRPRVLSLSHPS